MNIFYKIAYIISDKDTKTLIDGDVERNLKWDNFVCSSPLKRLEKCFSKLDYRNVLVFRLKSSNKIARFLTTIGTKLCPINKTIEIGGEIQSGLLISHLFSIVYVKKAGKNLRIGPGVVVGRNAKGFPTIGDNVYIAANSTVIGDIVIGDNVIIGAGSVVTKDIPSNSVVVGNPARKIRDINKSDYNEIML